jgi:glycine/D-amino acid oxidase-like deaminating enzyme
VTQPSDIAIIGGGIVSLATALALARAADGRARGPPRVSNAPTAVTWQSVGLALALVMRIKAR